jgi:hypothetical protein
MMQEKILYHSALDVLASPIIADYLCRDTEALLHCVFFLLTCMKELWVSGLSPFSLLASPFSQGEYYAAGIGT